LGAVRAKQTELQNIEQSIAELARLFQDLETLVIQDTPMIEQIDRQIEQADLDIIKGTDQVGIAQRSALNRRKLKWICLFVTLAIIIIVALIIVLWLKFVKKAF
jgi:syntaxin 1B/2/3